MTDFSLGQPHWLWALAVVPLLLGVFIRNEARRTGLLRQLIAARLHDRLAGGVSVAKRRFRFALLQGALISAIVALAQPRYGFTWEESKRRGRDLLIAIDTSRSMLADDLKPNRLARAKLAAQDLIAQLSGDRVGVMAFAGTAFLQAPLTADYSAVLASLAELDTEIIPVGGTNIAAAIEAAEKAFGKGESEHRSLIIFTDGEELDTDGVKAAEGVKEKMRIFGVGLGSEEGSVIQLPAQMGSGLLKNEAGQVVKSRLDAERLRKIAESTGGFYVQLLNGPAEMKRIVGEGLEQMSEKDIDTRLSRQPIERYRWPLAVSLLLLSGSMLVGERRRVVATAAKPARVLAKAAAVLLAFGAAAEATTNDAVKRYENSDYAGALKGFTEQLKRRPNLPALQFGLGAAAYKAGEYDRALEAFAKAVTSPDPKLRTKAEYNLGNTLYQRGAARQEKEPKVREWKGALEHYEEALKMDPAYADAAHNRDVVKKLLEELEKEPPKNDEQKDQKQDQQKDEKKDEKEQQGSDEKKDQQQSGEKEKNDGAEKKEGEEKEQSKGEQGEKKEQPGEKQDQQPADGSEQKDGKEKPKAGVQPAEKARDGELKEAPQYEKGENEAEEQAEAEALAAMQNKMTEKQAQALLESLKAEDDHVQLREPLDQRQRARPLRNW